MLVPAAFSWPPEPVLADTEAGSKVVKRGTEMGAGLTHHNRASERAQMLGPVETPPPPSQVMRSGAGTTGATAAVWGTWLADGKLRGAPADPEPP